MSPIQSVALAVRLFVVWLAIYCARWAPYLYVEARDSDSMGARLFLIGTAILFILFALFLWYFPRSVARSILPPGDLPAPTSPSTDRWFTVGGAMLGLWVLTDSVPGLAQNLYILVYARRANLPTPPSWASSTVYYAVELIVATWLLLGAAGMRKLLHRARGIDPE